MLKCEWSVRLFMQLFFSTSAHEIKSDCRKNATPFQMERLTNQQARLIAFQSRPLTEVTFGLLHDIQLQHLAQPNLAALFVDCVDDAPHDRRPLIHLMRLEPSVSWLLGGRDNSVSRMRWPRPDFHR